MLKKIYYNKYIWNPSYFVATVSDRSLKQVTDYINSQKPSRRRESAVCRYIRLTALRSSITTTFSKIPLSYTDML
ncbi:transposase [Ruminococcus albus]|uniref:transposase n=1 Tax=Ruminococcus albus TaxID=1264 RepID=UPI0009B8AD99